MDKSMMTNAPNTRKEQIDVVDIRDLLDELRNAFQECVFVVLEEDIEINSVPSTCRECLCKVFAGETVYHCLFTDDQQ